MTFEENYRIAMQQIQAPLPVPPPPVDHVWLDPAFNADVANNLVFAPAPPKAFEPVSFNGWVQIRSSAKINKGDVAVLIAHHPNHPPGTYATPDIGYHLDDYVGDSLQNIFRGNGNLWRWVVFRKQIILPRGPHPHHSKPLPLP